MKKALTLFSAFLFLGAVAFAQTETNESATQESGPSIDFEKYVHDFGEIAQGTPVSYKFAFTNDGNEPLVIERVDKVCGCTVTDWTKNAILPNQTGTVTAQYNAARMGKFKKPITVISNAINGSSVKLYFEGSVVDKDKISGVPSVEPTIMTGSDN